MVTGMVGINARDSEGRTAHQLAVQGRQMEVVRILVDRGAHTTSVGRFQSDLLRRIKKDD